MATPIHVKRRLAAIIAESNYPTHFRIKLLRKLPELDSDVVENIVATADRAAASFDKYLSTRRYLKIHRSVAEDVATASVSRSKISRPKKRRLKGPSDSVTLPRAGRSGSLAISTLAEKLVGLTILEALELKNILKEEYGIEPAAGSIAIAAGPDNRDVSGAASEKSEFDVVLVAAGNQRINVRKEVRAITGLGLKEAKELVEAGGKAVKEAASMEEAEEIKRKLEKAGATIRLV